MMRLSIRTLNEEVLVTFRATSKGLTCIIEKKDGRMMMRFLGLELIFWETKLLE